MVDPASRAVLTSEAAPRPRPVEDLAAAARALREEEARREELFQRSLDAHRNNREILSRKFDELLKRAKDDDPTKPPPKPLGLE